MENTNAANEVVEKVAENLADNGSIEIDTKSIGTFVGGVLTGLAISQLPRAFRWTKGKIDGLIGGTPVFVENVAADVPAEETTEK